MRILFLGHNKWACLTLKGLLDAGHDVLGVVTETDAFDREEAEVYERFARFGAYESLKESAEELGLPVHQPLDINSEEFVAQIDTIAPELIVCVSYHAILKKPLLERYPKRIINAHLAPLPHYRGRAPINWAIINGENHTAVTVHFIDEGVDTGPIIVQEKVPILPEDHTIDVLLRALPVFPKLVIQTVAMIARGEVKGDFQNPFDGTYFPSRTADDGLINWQRESAVDIHNKIRALTDPYPGAFSYCGNEKVILLHSQLPDDFRRISPVGGLVFGRESTGGVKITTEDGFLVVREVHVKGATMPAEDYLHLGAKLRPCPAELHKEGAE